VTVNSSAGNGVLTIPESFSFPYKQERFMSSQKVLWPAVVESLGGGGWVHVHKIFDHVQQHVDLDQDDHQDHGPDSGYPRWKRNVLHVLYRLKESGETHWAGGKSGRYRLNI
jgi:hypothetical protein